MGNRKFEEELDSLITLGADNEKANRYIESVKKYAAVLERITAEDEHHIQRRMTEEDHNELYEAFTDALKYSSEVNEDLTAKNISVPDKGKTDLETFTNDFNIIKEITDKKENVSLARAMNEVKSKVLEGEFSRNKMGAASSSRLVVNAVDKNGKIKTGLFTEEVRFTTKPVNKNSPFVQRFADNMIMPEPDERLDVRNTAMTDVAVLLGRGDLLAHSEEMKYESNGQVKTGTFMEFVDGTDIDKISMDKRERYYQVDPKDQYTSNLKKDALDLSIIDYICHNVDRHAGNMLYKYKKCDDGKVRLDGIVGIDNDGSFSTRVKRTDMTFNRLQALDDTVVISESMANAVMKLTPETLTAVLKNDKLSEKAIKAACIRLDLVKERIENGKILSQQLQKDDLDGTLKDILKDPVGSVRKSRDENKDTFKPMMIAVPDKHLAKIDINAIGKRTPDAPGSIGHAVGVCSQIQEVHSKRGVEYTIDHAKKNFESLKIRAPKVKRTTLDVASMCRHTTPYMADCFKRMMSRKGQPDAAYDEICKTVSSIAKQGMTIGTGEKFPSDLQLNRLSMSYKALQRQCKQYVKSYKDMKAAGVKISSEVSSRLAMVSEVGKETIKFQETLNKLRDKHIAAVQEEAALQADLINEGKMAPIPEEEDLTGTIERNEVKLDTDAIFSGSYANETDVRDWKNMALTDEDGNPERTLMEEAMDFDFPAMYEATHDDVNALKDACEKLYKNYTNLLKTDPVDISKWQKDITPKVNELRKMVDQYNINSDFIQLDDPKMHALSNIITGLQNISDKVQDKAMTDNLSLSNDGQDNRHEILKERLKHFNDIVDANKGKHSNSKDYEKLKTALNTAVNADKIDSDMMKKLSEAAGKYLSAKTKGIHLKSYADPVREFRLDLAKNIKMLADSNINRVNRFVVGNEQKSAVHQEEKVAEGPHK